MGKLRYTFPFAIAGLIFLAVLGGLYAANREFVDAHPGGNDFLARWMGARFALQGIQPYDERVATASQQMIYGHPADPARGEDLSRFAYPLYSMIFFAPFGFFDYPAARALWMTLLELAAAAVGLLTAAIGGWASQRIKAALWVFFCLAGYFGLRAIINGNPVVLVVLFLALSVFLLGKNRPAPAGVFLAFATIKPQIVVFPIFWILLWCLWQRRFSLIGAFSLTMAALIGASMIFVPDWIILNGKEILAYPGYTQPANPASIFGLWFGPGGIAAGWALSLLLLGGMLVVWAKHLRSPKQVFLIILGITISASPLLGIPFDPGNEFLLLLPLASGLSVFQEPSLKNAILWGAALAVVFFGLWIIFLSSLQPGATQSPVLLFPLPVLLWIWLARLYLQTRRKESGPEVVDGSIGLT